MKEEIIFYGMLEKVQGGDVTCGSTIFFHAARRNKISSFSSKKDRLFLFLEFANCNVSSYHDVM